MSRQTADITAIETARCKALVDADLPALALMLDDDLLHVHASGSQENKEQYLASIGTRLKFLEVVRETHDVTIFGDTALSAGWLRQRLFVVKRMEEKEMTAFTTQLWIRSAGAWRLRSFQATRGEMPAVPQ